MKQSGKWIDGNQDGGERERDMKEGGEWEAR